MADNDYSIIKPVESLLNVGNLGAANRRKERKKQQEPKEQKKQKSKPVADRLKESNDRNIEIEIAENDQGDNSIDYRA